MTPRALVWRQWGARDQVVVVTWLAFHGGETLPSASGPRTSRSGRRSAPCGHGAAGLRLPVVHPGPDATEWLAVDARPLPLDAVHDWCVQPSTGAVVLFSGTVRAHAADARGEIRSGVTHLVYEAYETRVIHCFRAVVAEARRRWPQIGRVAILHRVGQVDLGQRAVVVAVAAGHRQAAFEAGQYVIDAVKATAPIWKRESWETGDDWGTGASPLVGATDVPSPRAAGA